MSNKILTVFLCTTLLCGCTHLTRQEEMQLQQLKGQGVSVDKPVGNYEKPASVGAAAALNILPGVGNFYLASGDGADSSHWLYGFLNLLTWPLSVVWGIPEAAIDANNINQRELLYYYTYNPHGKKELQKANVNLD